MNVTNKVFSIIILIVILLVTIMPTANAISENIVKNQTEEKVLYEEPKNIQDNNTIDNKTNEKKESCVTSFDILMADILTRKEGNSFNVNDVPSIILNKPTKSGVFIEETSRDYLLDLFNSLTNKNFKINEDGYLTEDKDNLKLDSKVNKDLESNTDKILQLINSEKTIILSIQDNYKKFDDKNEIIQNNEFLDNEFSLVFNNNKELKDSTMNVTLLNSNKYSEENIKDTNEELLENLLNNYSDMYINNLDNNNDKEISDNTNTNEKNTIQDNNVSSDENIDEEEIIKTNKFDDRVYKKDWNLILAGVLSNNTNVNKDNLDTILSTKPTNNGIWISKDSRAMFLNFINQYTIYTYSVNEDGYLVCDNIMKTNENLDLIENTETDVDIVIKKLLNSNKLLVIDLSNKYLQYGENDEIITKELSNDQYTLSFSNNGNRILFLNKNFYNTTTYDLALSDYMIKAMQNIQEEVLSYPVPFSSRDIIGYSESSQNVYAGPDSTNYAKIGSVDAGEKLYILGTNAGWYHVQYVITGTNNGDGVELEKSGFIPKGTLSSISGTPSEEAFTGVQAYPQQGLNVQSCDDFDISTSIGSVFAGEGVTILYDYGYSDWTGKSYRVAFIEFSTSSGTKRGYVYKDQLDTAGYNTSVARVITTSPAYSGPDASYVKLGGAYYNEYVTILAKEGDWVFVEYNTAAGRKRGFMSYSNLQNCNHPGWYNDFPTNQGLRQATQQLTVYGGPNSNNANIGAVFNQEVVSYYGSERGYAYVEYSTTYGAKRGYVLESALTTATPPSLPNIPTYANFTSGTYGTSGLGQALKYYKIGNGSNVAFAVFAQHGWEDAWAYDGIELVNIADRVMKSLSSSGINSNWTLYIIPYANPDGITNGYTNNGPGRCTVTTKIDMNRSWPSKFSPNYTSRNYTGDSALGSPEGVALKNFISNNIGNNEKIILDIHGWLNQTYGDYSIAQYFDNQFGYGHSTSWGSGYLETWGNSIGAKACLIELPMPSSQADIISRDFSGKLTNGIKNMLNNVSITEGGTDVNESVVVISSDGNLNVRSGPGTSYPVISTLAPGTTVTRIKSNVTSANGYVWDKIRLSNGTEGYVATNYLQLVISGNTLSEKNVKIIKAYCRFNNINDYTGEINGTYDNSIYNTIIEFQRINELNRSGYVTVNDATWNAMELNKSSTYDLYDKIANNYINYNNPYGPSPYSVPNSDSGTKFAINQSKAKIPQQSTWDKRASEYNSMSASDRIINAAQLSKTKEALQVLAVASRAVYPHASEGVSHYLGKTGSTYVLSSNATIQFINDSANRKNLVDTYTNHAKNAVEHMLTIDKSANISIETAMNLKLNKSEIDWFALLGGYYFSIEGQCYKYNNTYSLAGNYYIRDYYDFDQVEGLRDMISKLQNEDIDLDDIAEAPVANLHYSGDARFYYIEGSYSFTRQWTK